ncbi:hypothetical protein ABIA35_000172 [Catenulispora sp. MAP12-49]|uniref:hypothetical protein n=1 Tax=unclassified Catenulispora TaxID=414885 RepID=UPI00351127FF
MIADEGTTLGTEAARRLAELTELNEGAWVIEPGLTPAEFDRVEHEFGFQFAADHRAFLAAGLPVSVPHDDPPGVFSTWREPWPDWRDADPVKLREQLDHPAQGVLFDVENNRLWHDTWGPRPEAMPEALAIAREALTQVPVLVPVYGHRFLPAGQGTFGHPVLSVWQTDIICYGLDIADYIGQEFGGRGLHFDDQAEPRVTVPFWRDFV